VSNLNGESLHDWINSELDIVRRDLAHTEDDYERAYHLGIKDTLTILKEKLRTKQVNPFGDRNPISD